MGSITDKLKKKVNGTKNKVLGTTKKASSTTKDKVVSSGSDKRSQSIRDYKQGKDDTRTKRRDSTQEYDEKEPMSPAKIKQHEPTAVRRDPSDQKIIEPGRKSSSGSEETEEKDRKSV
jgi:hypothetical protein